MSSCRTGWCVSTHSAVIGGMRSAIASPCSANLWGEEVRPRLHDRVDVGDVLAFGGPRNNFRLAPASRYLFVAAGIGITPLMPMIQQAERPERRVGAALPRAKQAAARLPRRACRLWRAGHGALRRRTRPRRVEQRGSPSTRAPGCTRAAPSGSSTPSSSGVRTPDGFPPKVERFTAADQSECTVDAVRGEGGALRHLDRRGHAGDDRHGAATSRRRRSHLLRPGRVRDVRDGCAGRSTRPPGFPPG